MRPRLSIIYFGHLTRTYTMRLRRGRRFGYAHFERDSGERGICTQSTARCNGSKSHFSLIFQARFWEGIFGQGLNFRGMSHAKCTLSEVQHCNLQATASAADLQDPMNRFLDVTRNGKIPFHFTLLQ